MASHGEMKVIDIIKKYVKLKQDFEFQKFVSKEKKDWEKCIQLQKELSEFSAREVRFT